MKKIFPISIIQHTTEYYQSKISVRSKTIYLAGIFLVFSILISLPLIKLDVAVQARGTFQTSLFRNEVISLVGGRLDNVHMRENMSVRKGDILATIKTEAVEFEIKNIAERKNQINGFISDLEKLILLLNSSVNFTVNSLTSQIYQAGFFEFQGNLSKYQAVLDKLTRDYERALWLFESRTIAFSEYDEVKLKYDQAKSNLEIYQKSSISKWELELVENQKEMISLNNQLILLNDRLDQFKIIAGVTGTLMNIPHLGSGDFIYPNQKLGEISPDSMLIAIASLSPSDIAFVEKGQKVFFQVDAFNYNQWGLLEGTVWEISDDLSMISDREVAFKVICRLDKDRLRLKNGIEGKIRKGMTFNGRFVIAKRSLFQLLHDKVDDWLNPLVS